MTAKEYLSEIQRLKKDIRIYQEIANNFHISYSFMHGQDYSSASVQTSPKNALEEAGWKMMEDRAAVEKALTNTTMQLNQRLEMIRSLSRPIYCEILFLRYYDNFDFKTISAKIRKEIGTVSNLHGEALAEFSSKYLDAIQKNEKNEEK